VSERLDTGEKLSDEDRETIIQIARKSLARYQPKFEPELKPVVPTEVKAKVKPEPEEKS